MSNIVEDGKTYTLDSLAETLGYRQGRTLERKLLEIGCPIRRLGAKKLISGKQFRLAIEKDSCSSTSSDGV